VAVLWSTALPCRSTVKSLQLSQCRKEADISDFTSVEVYGRFMVRINPAACVGTCIAADDVQHITNTDTDRIALPDVSCASGLKAGI
jgi:hypothetical protein